MDYNRFIHNKIQDGVDAEQLLENPVFFTAVERVLNKYAEMEENVLSDDQSEVREITAKIKQYAMMRRAMMDVVRELNDIVLEGANAAYDKEEMEI